MSKPNLEQLTTEDKPDIEERQCKFVGQKEKGQID